MMQPMTPVTFAIVYLGLLVLYAKTSLPAPNQGLSLLMIGTTIWAVFTIWLWICRRFPLLGWFLFGFLRGLLGRR